MRAQELRQYQQAESHSQEHSVAQPCSGQESQPAVSFGFGSAISGAFATTLGAAAGAAGAFFLCRKASAPRSRSSQYAFRKKMPERVSRMRLMNKPSTVEIVPVAIVQ